MSAPMLELEGISKRYGGVHALDDVSFDLQPGEVHALMGENGAGKSTLMKILCGIYRRDSGSIQLDGQPVHFTQPEALVSQSVVAHQCFRRRGASPEVLKDLHGVTPSPLGEHGVAETKPEVRDRLFVVEPRLFKGREGIR